MPETADEKSANPFDMNIPITWAIGILATALLTFGSEFTEVRNMNAQLVKLETKLDRQDANFQTVLAHFSDVNAKMSIMDMRVTQSEKEIIAIHDFMLKDQAEKR